MGWLVVEHLSWVFWINTYQASCKLHFWFPSPVEGLLKMSVSTRCLSTTWPLSLAPPCSVRLRKTAKFKSMPHSPSLWMTTGHWRSCHRYYQGWQLTLGCSRVSMVCTEPRNSWHVQHAGSNHFFCVAFRSSSCYISFNWRAFLPLTANVKASFSLLKYNMKRGLLQKVYRKLSVYN